MDKCYFMGCVKNCSMYIERVFENIRIISKNFSDYKIVIFYDDSKDDSLAKLFLLKELFPNLEIIVNAEPTTPHRTYNIAHARNKLIDFMNTDGDDSYKYFIMLDMDDVSAGEVNPDILLPYLKRDDWDSLSFNRELYYDTWAISIDPFIYSCWHFGVKSIQHEVVNKIQTFVNKMLNETSNDKLLTCYSAFNGLAIYRRDAFVNCSYNGNIIKMIELIEETIGPLHVKKNELFVGHKNTFYEDDQMQDCEHRHFHFQAIKNNGARIRISPLVLMKELTN